MKNYYTIDALEITQLEDKTGAIFSGKITFAQLLDIHRLTERKESLMDPFGDSPKRNFELEENDEFQRHLNQQKLTSIRNYLKDDFEGDEKFNAIFPSSVILSIDINDNNNDNIQDSEIEKLFTPELNSCFVQKKGLISKIIIPKNNRLCLIVDGQHRFYGMKKYYDDANDKVREELEKFEFISTFLIGYDPYQVAKVFANVNFNQKPVNRSLYYDIFGSSAEEKNEIQLAHFLALHMQNNEDSPLNGMIKLLGKGFGLFSQAFFVEKILIHFKESGVWYNLYKNYTNDGELFLEIPDFLFTYFEAIEFNYSKSWPQKEIRDEVLVYSAYNYESVLCKTTGIGAYFRLIKDIYPLVKDLNKNEAKDVLNTLFSKIKPEISVKLFSKLGEYGQSGSEGLQVKLYKHLKYKYEL